MTNKYEVGSHQNKISRGVDSSEQETFVYHEPQQDVHVRYKFY